MNKHITDKGVSNSLRGFFERVLKPYISNLFTSEAADASERYKMDYIGTYGSLAVFKKSLPTWRQYQNNNSESTEDQFIIERNKQVVFDSSTELNARKPFSRKVPANAKDFSALNTLLSDYAFPLNTGTSNKIFINPGDGSTQNVFYVSSSSSTETYDGEVLPIGSIKINNVFNIKCFYGYFFNKLNYYFSTEEDRPEKCGLYSLTDTSSDRSFTLKERILDNAKLREKLVEVLKTSDEELETKIESIRILDVASCAPKNYGRDYYKAYCMLLEVNKNKLISIYSYAQTANTTFNASTKQVDVFTLPDRVSHAQLRIDAYSGSTFRPSNSSRHLYALFKAYLETPIITDSNNVYRFVFDPGYKVVTESDSAGSTYKVIGVSDSAIVTFQQVNLGEDFTFRGAIDIIDREAGLTYSSSNGLECKRGNSYIATSNGLILFNTLSNSQQVASVTIFKPKILNNFLSSGIRGYNKIIKIWGNQGMYTGFLAVSSTYADLRWTYIDYSPDGIHWFPISNGTNKLKFTCSSRLDFYGSELVSNYDLRDKQISLDSLLESDDHNKIMDFVFYNKKEINQLNLNQTGYYSMGYSEIEAFYLIESNILGKIMPEIKRK